MISNCRPSEIDRSLRDRSLHGWRALALLRRLKHWRGDDDGLALDNWPTRLGVDIDTRIALEPVALQRLAALRPQLFVIWTLIDDCSVLVGDVGHVGRLVDDGDVTLGRHHCGFEPLAPKLLSRNKRVLIRTNIVIIIGPIVNAGAPIEPRLRRQRRPADKVLALPP